MGTPHNPISSGITPPTVPGSPTAPANIASFLLQDVPPPSPLYIQRDDQLVVQYTTGLSIPSVTVTVRILRVSDGQIVTSQFTVGGITQYVQAQNQFSLLEGWLLSMAVQDSLATKRGQSFCRVFINRGRLGGGQFNAGFVLFADYISNNYAIGWPGARVLSPEEGPGVSRTITGVAPGAGADWAITTITGAKWRIISLFTQLSTSATVANRIPRIQITDGTSTLASCPPNQVIPASTVSPVELSTVVVAASANVPDVMNPCPENIYLYTGYQVKSVTANIQAADQWQQQIMDVEEWLQNA